MMGASRPASAPQARLWRITGRVQGVGFRPFVYRLAASHGIAGWVRNRGGVVEVLAQGSAGQLQSFGVALLARAPPAARPQLLSEQAMAPEAREGFAILSSSQGAAADGTAGVHVPPDLFACEDCLAELHDPLARRHRYPFINCTQCGPRYTIIRALPYDRPSTTLAGFRLCPACQAEYLDPLDRRFHAQPLACPRCGPRLSWQPAGRAGAGPLHRDEEALASCLGALACGQIVAVRGIGGYHLLCDAGSPAAIAELRRRKHRPAKPLALMLPWSGRDGLQAVRGVARVSAEEAVALVDPARPIVLLRQRGGSALSEASAQALAPGLNEIGVMLPYSPLHHLLLEGAGRPLVATSGNVSGEPVITEPAEAQQRLSEVADGFLHHDRPIARPADDPVLRRVHGRVRALRLGRGTAPLELPLAQPLAQPTLAVGAYLKNTVALAWEDRAVISPHIGDLDSPRSRSVFERVADDLQQLYGVRARQLVHDAHPDFPNSRWARQQELPSRAVWHHHAHAAALFGERACSAPLLCFTWDGVGLGADGTLWGGEALLGMPGSWTRVGSLKPFRLPGGERAARAPWRSALGLCWSSGTSWPETEAALDPLLRQAFDRGLNAPATSAVGRLFDAAAALVGICREASYEGEAPMRLEALAADTPSGEVPAAVQLPLSRDPAGVWRADWTPLLEMLLDARYSAGQRAACFHVSLAEMLCRQALAVRASTEVEHVGLCGGVFQNRVLCGAAAARLAAAGFEVLLPERLPSNDAAISFGQLLEAAGAARLGAAGS